MTAQHDVEGGASPTHCAGSVTSNVAMLVWTLISFLKIHAFAFLSDATYLTGS